MLDIKLKNQEDVQVLALIGELDIATVDKFKAAVEAAKVPDKTFELDMSQLEFVDSTGVGGLLRAIKGLQGEQITVQLTNISPEVFEVFDLLGLPLLLGQEVFR